MSMGRAWSLVVRKEVLQMKRPECDACEPMWKVNFQNGDLKFAEELREDGEGKPCMQDVIFGVI